MERSAWVRKNRPGRLVIFQVLEPKVGISFDVNENTRVLRADVADEAFNSLHCRAD
jgi:hypothetical protein